jgi:hypothetical protein
VRTCCRRGGVAERGLGLALGEAELLLDLRIEQREARLGDGPDRRSCLLRGELFLAQQDLKLGPFDIGVVGLHLLLWAISLAKSWFSAWLAR